MTSPGSPDLQSTGRNNAAQIARYANRLTPAGPAPIDPNIGGRIQIKLGYEPGLLQLIVTTICATNLTIRANGTARNPFIKVSFEDQKKKIDKLMKKNLKNLF